MNYFERLNKINVSEHIEKKNGLSYLSWAWAWAELKKVYPNSFFTVYENPDGWNYFTDGRTAWVKTGVTVDIGDGMPIEHIEYLPIMDYRNKSIPLDSITSFDVNKSIQRSLTKAVARHGLGLYVYAGEDLPEDAPQEKTKATKKEAPQITQMQLKDVYAKLLEMGATADGLCRKYDLYEVEQMNTEQYSDFCKGYEGWLKKNA